jgi:hypothetical protein
MFTAYSSGRDAGLGYYVAVQKFTHTSHLVTRKFWARHARICRISLVSEWSKMAGHPREIFA